MGMKDKENKQKYKRTKRHYCAERNCLDCPIQNVYDCCADEIMKVSINHPTEKGGVQG